MTPFRLRSQLLIAALLIILGLTGSLLFFVRHTVNVEIQKQVRDGTDESVRTFESSPKADESFSCRAWPPCSPIFPLSRP